MAVRGALAVVAACLLLPLAACAADPPPAAAPTVPVALTATASQLCGTYCAELRAWPSTCPPGATSMTLCSSPMARATDVLRDMQQQLAAADPQFPARAAELHDRIAEALGFWEEWSHTPPGEHDCMSVFDIDSPLFSPPTVGRCTSAAASMRAYLPDIAAHLQALAGS